LYSIFNALYFYFLELCQPTTYKSRIFLTVNKFLNARLPTTFLDHEQTSLRQSCIAGFLNNIIVTIGIGLHRTHCSVNDFYQTLFLTDDANVMSS